MRNLVCFHEALASEHRLRILYLVHKTELSVQLLQEVLQTDQQSKVSRHLAYLKKANLVTARREGKWIFYKLQKIEKELRSVLLGTLKYLSKKPEIQVDERRLHELQQQQKQE